MDKKFALVLSGGGAKGIYQIGVWKALRELKINFEIIVGTSIGALNAGLIIQNDYKKAEKLWKNIEITDIINIPEKYIKDGAISLEIKNIKELFNLYRQTEGLDTSPLKNLISQSLNEDTIRNSKTKLGLVTVYKNKILKGEYFFEEDIPKGELGDYLLASASFPIFKDTVINNKKYIDGGLYDNIPYKVIKNSGYKNIIVVDISGVGINKRPDIKNENIIYIKNSIKFGSIKDFFGVLNFNKDFLEDFFLLGYLDTCKIFEKVKGIKYFIVPDKLSKEVEKKLADKQNYDKYKILIPSDFKHFKEPEIALLDCAATFLDIPKIKKYTYTELFDKVKFEFLNKKGSIINEILTDKQNKKLVNFLLILAG